MELQKIDMKNLLNISHEISLIAKEQKLNYIDACLFYCEKYQFDEDYLGEIVKMNHSLVSNIRKEAEELNFLRKENRLSFDS